MDLDAVRFDAAGLVVAVAQDAYSGEVRMVAWMNREAVRRTLDERVAWFWSRSRHALWKKGESSGNTLAVRSVHLDCDGDSLLLLVDPAGPTCHTGAPGCFTREATGDDWRDGARPGPSLLVLDATLASRREDPAASGRSYARALFDAGAERIGEKLREEADELARAAAGEADARVVSEAADLIFHAAVALASRGLSTRDALAELARRHGVSGLVEKASRGSR